MGSPCRVLWIVLSILTIMTPACSKNQSENKKESGKSDGSIIGNSLQPWLPGHGKGGSSPERSRKTDLRNESGYTPLHWAVLTNQEEIVSLFISRGAEIQPTSTSGYTPLHDAVYGGNPTMVKLLIAHGADIYAADQLGKRPLDLAIERGHAQIVPLLKPLHLAAEKGDLNRVKNIVEKNPESLNLKDERGWSPLHLAGKKGHLEIAKFLIERGAEINARGVRGVTPLRMALD